jgi:cell division protein FtsW (lipid II flippase)
MKKLLLSILAVFLIIEEWLWDGLSACGHYLIALLRLESFERWLTQTTPNTALLAFLIPVLIVTPINLAAIWLMIQGLLLQGILLEIFAKLLGTLLVARVFTLTKSQLLSFRVINAIYTTISGWLRWAHQKVVDTAIYRYSKVLKAEVKARVKAFFG